MARLSRRQPWITEGVVPNDDYVGKNQKKKSQKIFLNKKIKPYYIFSERQEVII